MQFKRKGRETMLWIDSLKKIVRFNKNGVANVDEKTGKEMKKLGYIENSESVKPESKTLTKEEVAEKAKFIKPIKPISDEVDSKINNEV